MNINLKYINFSCLFSLLSLLLFPGSPHKSIEDVYHYGFPHHYLTIYHTDPWLIKGIALDLLYFALNALYVYLVLMAVTYIFNFARQIFDDSKK